ncbi:Radial spokehead-like protein [Giardia muris]|uniref:Radial spokehead-like protein n=1 Tax=Giardia muris TaxID=5742 RepID=A0A4Z1SXQ9_GIAMU|nr:Radial spokehead-like protein [Giardia muris]|eukprot:TNJ28308.1 Radial spokehead-like protein [Giardia muris]
MDRVNEFIDYLQVRNAYGQTLYGHLAQIVAKLLDDHPEDAALAMASISREIKASVGCFDSDTQAIYQPLMSDQDFSRVEELLHLFSGWKPEESVLRPCRTIIPDIVKINTQLQLIGEGLDSVTASVLQKRIVQFECDRRGRYEQISFFGRFETTHGFYYVLECLPFKQRKKLYRYKGMEPSSVNVDLSAELQLEKAADEPESPVPSLLAKDGKPANYTYLTERKIKKLTDQEREMLDPDDLGFDLSTIAPPPKLQFPIVVPIGDNVHPEGVNRFEYFVTTNIIVDQIGAKVVWEQLPDLEARQLQLSRFIAVRLSGDLRRRVHDRIPPFPGCEAHYLRCLIARIKHGAELAPSACLVPGPEPEEVEMTEEEEKQQQQLALADVTRVFDFSRDSCEPDEPSNPALMARSVLPWPVRNKEIAGVEFTELLELASWVHTCPVISHHGKVLPWTYPEEEEPEEEEPEEEPEEEKEEVEEEAEEEPAPEEPPAKEEAEEEGEEEKEPGEDGVEEKEEEEEEEEEEPLPPPKRPVADRLADAYKESDQLRILGENSSALKEIAKQKRLFVIPRPFWAVPRDAWDPILKENRCVYSQSRYFGLEMAPVDINCKELELGDKEREYWDKQQEAEDALKEDDEKQLEGDAYDPDKEVIQGDRPEVLASAETDAPIIIHLGGPEVFDVAAVEVDGQRTVPAYAIIYNKTLNRHSPVVVRSNRWPGMLNVCYNYGNGGPLTYASVYIGDGLQTASLNALDRYRSALPGPMQVPPADLLEEDDPVLEIENECNERVADLERKDKDELDRLLRERLERKEARLAEKRARAEERARERAAAEEQEEQEEGDEEEDQ